MTENDIKEMNEIKWWHCIELEPGLLTPGLCTHGALGTDYFSDRFGFPTDFEGQTALDIGAWDGLFSFEAEKRNASRVVAIDVSVDGGGNWGGTRGFNFAKRILKSRVEFYPINVYDLDPNEIGLFDVVLQFGVLYHLKNPLLGIENTAKVTKKYALIETAIIPKEMRNDSPVFAFMPGYNDDPRNYFYPNISGLEAALLFAGFKAVEILYNDGVRATAKAVK